MYQIAVDKADDDVGHLRLRLESLAKPHLDILVVAKAARYGKDHSQYGHNGQHHAIGQRRGLLQHTLGSKEANGQHHFLQYL